MSDPEASVDDAAVRRAETRRKIDQGIASLREVQREALERAQGLVRKVSDPHFRAVKG